MTDVAKRNLIAQWAFDTRPVLLRFHLWLEDVEVERAQAEPVSAYTFTPRGIARCLAMTSAATALGTRLFGDFGAGAGKDKVDAQPGEEGRRRHQRLRDERGALAPHPHAAREPRDHGLPRRGPDAQGGRDAGDGRQPACSASAASTRGPSWPATVDRRVRRLLNEPGHTFEQFYEWLQGRGITLWGAAVDTLENTSRFAEGQAHRARWRCFHLFDSPLRLARPYESYMGCLTVPARVAEAAEQASVLLDYRTPRKQVAEAIEAAYPGIRRENIHVWTLRGKSRVHAAGPAVGGVGEGSASTSSRTAGRRPPASPVFTDSGTYAPTFLVGSWKDDAEATHVFLVRRLRGDRRGDAGGQPLRRARRPRARWRCSRPSFDAARATSRRRLMQLDPAAPDFAASGSATLIGGRDVEAGTVRDYAEAIRGRGGVQHAARQAACCSADDFLPEKDWRVLASVGYMCDDPYTGAPGVTQVADDAYRVTTRLATRKASSLITFTLRLMESLETTRQVFSPLLVRFLSGVDHTTRPVQDLRLRAHPQRAADDDPAGARARRRPHPGPLRADQRDGDAARQAGGDPRRARSGTRRNHPVWFDWLDLA